MARRRYPAAATSPTVSLNATRPLLNGSTAISATVADGSDASQNGRVQDIEWDLNNNPDDGQDGFEAATLGDWSNGLASPQVKSVSTNGMTPGLKTVRVRVGDNGALVGADDIRRTKVATATYLVDSPPVADDQSVIARPGEPKQITLTASDADGDPLTYSMVSLITPTGTLSLTGNIVTYTPGAQFTGLVSFIFTAKDGYGGEDNGFIQARVAPRTVIDDPAPTAIGVDHASFAFSSPTASASFECRLDSEGSAGWEVCSPPHEIAGLSEGAHRFEVRAISGPIADPEPAEHDFTVYLTPPETTIDAGPQGPTGEERPEFEFSSNVAGSTFQCRIDAPEDGEWMTCSSPASPGYIADGEHRFEVRAIDPAGNVEPSPAVAEFTIYTEDPTASIDSAPPELTGSSPAVFEFSANVTNAAFECRVDGQGGDPFTACESPKTYQGLSDGSHLFEVRATDPIGHQSAVVSHEWAIDTVAPVVTITGQPGASTLATDAEFTFTNDKNGSFECAIDSGAWAPCTSPFSVSGLTVGAHHFQVRATDDLGNTSEVASYDWEVTSSQPVDPKPPVLKLFAKARWNRAGLAKIGRVSCPEGSCRITVRRKVRLKKGKRAVPARIKVPKVVAAGKSAPVKLRLPKRSRRALKHARVKLQVKLRVTSSNGESLQKTRRIKLRPGPATSPRR